MILISWCESEHIMPNWRLDIAHWIRSKRNMGFWIDKICVYHIPLILSTRFCAIKTVERPKYYVHMFEWCTLNSVRASAIIRPSSKHKYNLCLTKGLLINVNFFSIQINHVIFLTFIITINKFNHLLLKTVVLLIINFVMMFLR